MHLLPAFICFLTIFLFYIKSGEEKLSLFVAPSPDDLELATNRILYYGLMLLSWFYYAWKALEKIKIKSSTFDSRTLKGIRTRTNWLINYTRVFIGFLFLFLTIQLVFVFSDLYPYYLMLSTILASSFLVHFVGYWALRESRITNSENRVGGKLNLPETKIKELKKRIIELLEREKIHQKADLSINDFGVLLEINTKYLSQVINEEFNCGFTYLVNSYRVTAAKDLIINKKFDHLNFLGITIEVGFNTKNTFTRTFKRRTGMTPSQYKLKSN